MSEDRNEILRRLQSIHENDATEPASPTTARPAQPSRPALPPKREPKPATPRSEQPQPVQSPQAPVLTGTQPSPSEAPVVIPATPRSPARVYAAGANADDLRRTLQPSCLVLGITLPMLAGGWFTLDEYSVLRDNALGHTLPMAIGVLGLFFLGMTALLMIPSRKPTTAETANV